MPKGENKWNQTVSQNFSTLGLIREPLYISSKPEFSPKWNFLPYGKTQIMRPYQPFYAFLCKDAVLRFHKKRDFPSKITTKHDIQSHDDDVIQKS